MSNESPKFDIAGYTKSLERTLEIALHDLWTHITHINSHQVNVGRTYLWVAVALLGSYFAGLNLISSTTLTSLPTWLFWCFNAGFFVACVLAVIAFGLCLFSIPSRRGYKMPYEKGWGDLALDAYKITSDRKEEVYPEYLRKIINKVDTATAYNVATNQIRAKKLRRTSWFLFSSFTVAVVGASLIFSSIIFNSNLNLEVVMTDKIKPENSQPTQTTTSTPDQPTGSDSQLIPGINPPEQPVERPSTISTHGQESTPQTVIITEGKETKK